MTELFKEQTLTFNNSGGVYLANVSMFGLTAWREYTVIFDGTEHRMTAVEMVQSGTHYIVLGNPNLVWLGDDNGDPFAIADVVEMGVGYVSTKNAPTTHTVAIYESAGTGSRNVLFPMQTVSGFAFEDSFGVYQAYIDPPPFSLTVGEVYRVKWDGVEYECVAQDANDVMSGWIVIGNAEAFGLVGNGEPFIIAYNAYDVTFAAFDDKAEHEISVYQGAEEEPETPDEPTEPEQPEQPEGIVLKDRNGEDVAYYGIETVTFDTTTEGKQQVYTKGVAVEGLEIVPDFSTGDMAVVALPGTLIKSMTIKKPESLTPENIRINKNVCGIPGAFPVNPFIEYTLDADGEPIAAKMYGFTEIPYGCFSSMRRLQTVDLTESPGLNSIGDKAFDYCTSMTEFIIPASVTNIGAYAFRGCAALTNISIPDGVTSIGNYTFYECRALKSINIPGSVASIGEFAFYNCNALTSLVVQYGVTSIGKQAFYNCTAMASVVLPDSLTSIGIQAFCNCTSLTSVDIPGSVSSISSGTFQGCSKLATVTIGSGVTTISNSMFANCAVKSIDIPDSVTLIDMYAFNFCASLASVIIGSGVSQISYNAFYGCSALTSATFRDTTTWYRTSNANYTGGSSISSSYLTNTSTSANYLRSTYVEYYWYKT